MVKIKETTITMTIQNQPVNVKVTKLINGYLENIIYISDKLGISYEIHLNKYPHIRLTKQTNMGMIGMITPRTITNGPDNDQFNFTQDKWALNDKLLFLVDGTPGTRVKFIIRYT